MNTMQQQSERKQLFATAAKSCLTQGTRRQNQQFKEYSTAVKPKETRVAGATAVPDDWQRTAKGVASERLLAAAPETALVATSRGPAAGKPKQLAHRSAARAALPAETAVGTKSPHLDQKYHRLVAGLSATATSGHGLPRRQRAGAPPWRHSEKPTTNRDGNVRRPTPQRWMPTAAPAHLQVTSVTRHARGGRPDLKAKPRGRRQRRPRHRRGSKGGRGERVPRQQRIPARGIFRHHKCCSRSPRSVVSRPEWKQNTRHWVARRRQRCCLPSLLP